MESTFSTLAYNDFTYKRFFDKFTEEEFIEARDIVMSMWSGVLEMWGACSEEIKLRKRSACLNLLVAWYLADTFPDRVVGLQTSGGMPISQKSIEDGLGGITIKYKDFKMPEAYDALSTNQFGIKAAMMIRYAPDMMGVYGIGSSAGVVNGGIW